MKTLLRLLFPVLVMIALHSSAQSPQAIPYQAVARDNDGNLIANHSISLRFSIHDLTTGGPIVYRETQGTTTNLLGLFSVNVGQGIVVSGSFADINWGGGAKFLQVELDTAGGSNYTDMGTSQMLSVPYALFADSSNFRGVIYDTSLMIINTVINDTVFFVDKHGKSRHKGREIFYGGVTVHNDTLVVTDSVGVPVFIIYPNGKSYHKGREHFGGGVIIGDPDGARVTVDPDGRIKVIDDAGNVVFEIAPNGDSYHAGFETFSGGASFGLPGGSRLEVGTDGSISIKDASGTNMFSVAANGDSYHKGYEEFGGGAVFGLPGGSYLTIGTDGGISITDGTGYVVFSVAADGTSFHHGVETFENGAIIGSSNGEHIELSQGELRVVDSNGNIVYTVNSAGQSEQTGTSIHNGLESFKGGIEVKDANDNVTFSVAPDGTSMHLGEETFKGGAVIGNPTGAHITIAANGDMHVYDQNGNNTSTTYSGGGTTIGSTSGTHTNLLADGTIEIRDGASNLVFQVNPDGTSFHKGLETFAGGIIVKDASGNVSFSVAPDGSSYHAGNEIFAGGMSVGTIGGAHTYILADGTIEIRDAAGSLVYQVLPDGTSTHTGLETFKGGIQVKDAGGSVTFSVATDGTSTHQGHETFNGGVTIGNPSGSHMYVSGDGSAGLYNAGGTLVWGVLNDGTSVHAGLETFTGGIAVNNSNASVTGSGIFSGNGSGITNMNASSISTGTLSDARLTANVPLKNTANSFSQQQSINVPGGTAFQCGSPGLAAVFNGNVQVNGNLTKLGGTFRIDHPLDPANKYLSHSFVESPDMMNIYNGNNILGDDGKVTVELPEWFETLNKDFRYQLTCIGGFAPIFIEKEISGNRFTIAGGKPGMKVSWQVTGVRQDAYANEHRVKVEEDKPVEARGTYLYPEAFGGHK